MKKLLFLFLLILTVLTTAPSVTKAGSLMVGMKGWYAFWGGIPEGLSKIADDEIDEGIEYGLNLSFTGAANSETNSSDETGKGFLAGPVIGYQTDDRMWSLSLALMYLSVFDYDTTSTGTFTVGAPENLNGTNTLDYSIELKRREIDMAVSRTLNSRLKVFAGYKYQSSENKLKITGTISEPTIPFSSDVNSETEIKIFTHMPTAGLGFVHPLTNSVFLGLQTGILYVIPKYESETKDNITGAKSSESSDLEKTFGVNLEASVSFLIKENIILQGGYRYQGMKIKNSDGSLDVWDSFHGVTLSALYLFNP